MSESEVVIIKFSVYGKHFEKSVPKSLFESKTRHQIIQQAYKSEQYKIVREKGIGANKYILIEKTIITRVILKRARKCVSKKP